MLLKIMFLILGKAMLVNLKYHIHTTKGSKCPNFFVMRTYSSLCRTYFRNFFPLLFNVKPLLVFITHRSNIVKHQHSQPIIDFNVDNKEIIINQFSAY